MSGEPLRVAIDARLRSGESGGTEQFVIGLAGGLSRLDDGDDEYFFLVFPGEEAWIEPYVDGPCRILRVRASPPRWKEWRFLHRVRRALLPVAGKTLASIPISDGTIERAAVDVMHFALQSAFVTDVPSIYHPWDLQHRHFPEFFSADVRHLRDVRYRAFCDQARMVAVASEWGKRDLVEQYGIDPRKIKVLPLAPPTTEYPAPSAAVREEVRRRYELPDAFAFYPAQTWPHKNHLGLLDALAILRARGIRVPLVCSGRQNDFFPKILERARELGLADDVRFVGFVTPVELQALYELCRCVVFPTKFEGGGFPVLEAFRAAVATACSNVTLLPEQAAGAALLFDPDDREEIADALARLWTDERLRRSLGERGRKRAARSTWDATARHFRAHYHRIAGTLTDEDEHILAGERGARLAVSEGSG